MEEIKQYLKKLKYKEADKYIPFDTYRTEIRYFEILPKEIKAKLIKALNDGNYQWGFDYPSNCFYIADLEV